MTLIIELTPAEEAQLTAAAHRAGVAPAEFVRKLVTAHLPAVVSELPTDPTLTLFAQWGAEDAQMTPEEIADAQREYDEFSHRMNVERARAGARILYP